MAGPQRLALRTGPNRFDNLNDHAGGGNSTAGGERPSAGGSQRPGGQGTLPIGTGAGSLRGRRREQRKKKKQRRQQQRDDQKKYEEKSRRKQQRDCITTELMVWSWNMAGGLDTSQGKGNSATRDELYALLIQHTPDVVMLQETWLAGNNTPSEVWLDAAGYVWYGVNRVAARGTRHQGGCGILVAKSLAGKPLANGSHKNITRHAAIRAASHTGTIGITLALGGNTKVNLVTSYIEDATACSARKLNIGDIFDGLTAELTHWASAGLTVWGMDANAHTADLTETIPVDLDADATASHTADEPESAGNAPPPRAGALFDDGTPRPSNKHGRLLMDCLGTAAMRTVHDRDGTGTWQHTCARPIASKKCSAAEQAEENAHTSPNVAGKSYAHTVIDYIAVNDFALENVRQAKMLDAGAGATLSDHRILSMVLDVGMVVQRQKEADAIVTEAVPTLNCRKLVSDPRTRQEFQTEVAARMRRDQHGWAINELPTRQQLEDFVSLLTSNINGAIEGTAGWMNPKGHNSVDGRARKWFTPAVNAAVNNKMKVMRASEAVFSDTKKSPHEQAEARKLFTTARNQAATTTKKAKQMWQQNVFKAIEEHELKSRKNGHSGAATWKAMNNLGNTYAQPRKVHPVLNKAAELCNTPSEIANAHRENLAGLAAPISISADPTETKAYTNDATARAATGMVAALVACQEGPKEQRAPPKEVLAQINSAEQETPALAADSSTTWSDHMAADSADNRRGALNADILPPEVTKAIEHCACNTAPGEDGITYEVLKALPVAAILELTAVYQAVLRTHSMPSQWKAGVVSMLFKDGVTNKCTNYRGLTLLNTMGKVFERVLFVRLTAHLVKHKLRSRNQIGFEADCCTQDHVFVMQQTVEANPNCLALFVDIRKAYPTVFRDGLFTKLAQRGIGGDMWSTMKDMYTNLTSQVKVAGTASEEYPMETGLMEGAILSPLLYTIFIDDLAKKFEQSGLGCKIGNVWTGALYYADDLCLMANSHAEMQAMLDILDQYCRDWKFAPSYSKTKMLQFGTQRTGPHKDRQVYLPTMWHQPDCTCTATWATCTTHKGCKRCTTCHGCNTCSCCANTEWDQGYIHTAVPRPMRSDGTATARRRTTRAIARSNPVRTAREYVYLGVLVTDDAKFTSHLQRKVTPKVKAAAARLYEYYATDVGLSPTMCAKLIQSLAEPNLRYCSAVWAPMEVPAAHARSQWSVTKTATEEASAAYTTALRTALGTSRHTKSRTIYEAMRLRMAVDIWQSEVLQYWDRLRRMPEDRLARRVYEEAVKSSSSFVARVTAAHQAIFNVPPSWSQAPPGKHKVRKNMNAALDTRGEKEWYDHVRAHEKDGAALYLQVPPPSRSPFLRLKRHGQYSEEGFNQLLALRTHGHALAALVGRNGIDHDAVPLDERVCPRCAHAGRSAVEDETHFVVGCPCTADGRNVMLDAIAECFPHFRSHYDRANDVGKTKLLLWQIPDGQFPGASLPGMSADTARIRSTRAVIAYLRQAAQDHPRLKLYNRPRS